MKWLVDQLGELLGVEPPAPEETSEAGGNLPYRLDKLIADLAEVLRQPRSTMH